MADRQLEKNKSPIQLNVFFSNQMADFRTATEEK